MTTGGSGNREIKPVMPSEMRCSMTTQGYRASNYPVTADGVPIHKIAVEA